MIYLKKVLIRLLIKKYLSLLVLNTVKGTKHNRQIQENLFWT